MKISPHFNGLYKLLECIVPVANHLHLPPNSKIHPVFHVSYLKTTLGTQVFPQQHLLEITFMGEVYDIPATILDQRIVKRNNCATAEVLIQWAHLPQDDVIWETYATIKEQFPDFHGL